MRQIVEALGIKPQFEGGVLPKGLSLFTMTEYKESFPFPVLFPQEVPTNTLAEWLAKKDLTQFHCAGEEVFVCLFVRLFVCFLCLSVHCGCLQRLRSTLT